MSRGSAVKEKKIQDIALASFLLVSGNSLVRSPLKDGTSKRLIFVFEETEKLEKDVLSFYNRTARVDPLSFFEMLRSLKALTFGKE